jgi:hypothetical protein
MAVVAAVGMGGSAVRADTLQYGSILSYNIVPPADLVQPGVTSGGIEPLGGPGMYGDSTMQTVYGNYSNSGGRGVGMIIDVSDIFYNDLSLNNPRDDDGIELNPYQLSTQTLSQKVGAGQSAYFSVSTSGSGYFGWFGNISEIQSDVKTPTYTFQWQASTDGGATWVNLKDDGTYAGTATNALWIVNPTLAMNGTQVRMQGRQWLGTYVVGQAMSRAATLTVVNGKSVAALVTSNPTVDVALTTSNLTVEATLAVHLTANSTAQAANFTWEKSTDAGATWTVVAGNSMDADGTEETLGGNATQPTLDISNLTLDASGWKYRVTAANPYGSATSPPVTLTVLAPTPPAFTAQPADAVITTDGDGSIADFNTTVASATAVSYAWELSGDGGKTWKELPNTNGPHLQVGNVLQQWLPELELRCAATNVWGTVASQAAVLHVNVAVQITVQVGTSTLNPAKQQALAGGKVTLTASPIGIGTTYQWLKNGRAIKGATGTTLVLNNAQAGDAGIYTVKVSQQGTGRMAIYAVALAVVKAAPIIMQHSGSATVASGGTKTFTVTAQGTAPLTYRWKKDGVYVANGATVRGANTAALTLSKATAKNAGSYQVVVKNSVGTVTSGYVVVTVK